MAKTKEQKAEYMRRYRRDNPQRIKKIQDDYDNSEKGAMRTMRTVSKTHKNNHYRNQDVYNALGILKALEVLQSCGWRIYARGDKIICELLEKHQEYYEIEHPPLAKLFIQKFGEGNK